MKKIIISGSTSFIGIALIKLLVKEGYSVTAIIRPNSNRKKILQILFPQIIIVECELFKLGHLVLPEKEYDIFYHIGWNSDFSNDRYNLSGQLKNVEYCEQSVILAAKYKCKSYLCVGSQAECGLVSKPINSFTRDNPMNAYAEAKCMAYDKTKEKCKIYGIKQFWPRLLSAYGPYDRSKTLVMSCISACREKRVIELSLGEQIWDYIYINDVARAMQKIVENGESGKKYSIASGEGKPLLQYIEKIADVLEYPQLLEGVGMKEYTLDQVMYLVGDIEELCVDTGFYIENDFEKGILSIVDKNQIGEL